MEKAINDDQKVQIIERGRKITNVFLERQNMKKLLKNSKDKMIFGVCSGIADYIGLDVSIVRLFFVIGALVSGSILFWLYILLGIILPSEQRY